MKKKIILGFSLLLIIFFIVYLTNIILISDNQENIAEIKTLRVGIYPNYKPYCYKTDNNTYQGYNLDVLLSIMTETQRDRFEERGEYDMSFSIPRCGRYRVNALKVWLCAR